MAISAKLKDFLKTARIAHTAATHPVVYTAQEIAAAQHVPGRQLAKSVLVKTERGFVLAVLPAIALIDFKKLKSVLRVKNAGIAKESDIKSVFPDVEVGAMSPFGNIYGVPVTADRSLEGSEHIVFNAGSHTDTLRIRFKDFAAAVKPQMGAFAQAAAKPKRKAAPKKKSRPASASRKPAAKKKLAARKKRR